jgi:hypothetical protein
MGHTTKYILTWKNDFKKQATRVTRVHCKVASKASRQWAKNRKNKLLENSLKQQSTIHEHDHLFQALAKVASKTLPHGATTVGMNSLGGKPTKTVHEPNNSSLQSGFPRQVI